MSLLNKAQIVAAASQLPETKEVEVKSWGGSVLIGKLGAVPALAIGKRLAGAKRDAADQLVADEDTIEFLIVLLKNCIIDANHAPMFQDGEGEAFLRKQPFTVLMELGEAAMEINNMAEKKPLDGIKKKSKPAPTGASPSN